MSRRYIKAHITFEFDRNYTEETFGKMTDREFVDYALETYIEDIYQLVKSGEVQNAVKVEFLETASA